MMPDHDQPAPDRSASDPSAFDRSPMLTTLEITKPYISRFTRRAKGLFTMAAAILLMIFSLLGFGGFVFYSASDIAAKDISGGETAKPIDPLAVETRIQSLEAEIKLLQAIFDEYNDQWVVGKRTILEIVQIDRERNAARGRLKILTHKLLVHRPTGSIPNLDIFESRRTLKIVRETLATDLKILKNASDILTSNIDYARGDGSAARSDRAARLETDLEVLNREISQSADDSAYVERLLDVGQEPEGARVDSTAEESDELSGETLQILQTNITRFGGLLLIFFFIRIMLPIYRYFVGLGTIYNGQADALVLVSQTDEQDLGKLVATMTPTLGFDSAPSTPIENTLKLIKEIAPVLARR